MDTRDLAKMDLNLLISLQVLLEERNVSRAAKRLHITQPAMSKTLSRLRELFGDPLFTRSSHGMLPTPRAEELATDLAAILGNINELVSGTRFDPATCKGEINLALSEYIGVALLPRLIRKLQSEAPQLDIRVISRIENQLGELAQGNLDFAIHIEQLRYSPDFRVEPLGSSPPALLVRDSHPLTHGEITWKRLTEFPLIQLYVSDREQLEIQRNSRAYESILNRQKGSLEISHLLTALDILRNTDYFMPAPSYILQNEGATMGITALPVPAGEDHSLNYVLVAHKRTAGSALHNWLWDQITCTIRELRPPQPRKMRQRIAAGSIESPGSEQ